MSRRFYRACAVVALVSSLAGTAIAAEPSDPVVAIVNGTSIHRSALAVIQEETSRQQGRAVPFDSNYDAFLGRAISDQLILDTANKQKLDSDPEVKKALQEMKNNLLIRAWVGKALKKAEPEISDAVAKERFDALLQKWQPQEQVKAAHILVDSEDKAKAIIADLTTGASWDEEARTKSKDVTKDKGGELGWIEKDRGVPAEFGEAAFALKVGEVSKTPVRTQFGWHVIKSEDRRMSPPPTFEQAKEQIRLQLAQIAVSKSVEDMQKTAQIKRFKSDGTPLEATAKP